MGPVNHRDFQETGPRSLLIPEVANRGRCPLRQSWAKTIILLVAFLRFF